MFVYPCARLRLCYGHVTDLVTYYGAKHPSCLHPETAGPLRQAILQPVALSSCPPCVLIKMAQNPAATAAKERLVSLVEDLG